MSVRRVLTGVSVIVVVAIVAVVAVGAYALITYQNFASSISHIDAIPADSATAPGPGENILLVGDDHRPDGASAAELAELGTTADGGGTSTDTMMVLHIADDAKSATLISFPRDSWVDVPGYGNQKLNAAFALGTKGGTEPDALGAQLLVTTIENVSGLRIDHFVRLSLLGFYDVARALGPVTVCLNNAVNDPYSTLVLPAGVSTLNAQQALSFVRQRHGLPMGDLDRVARQQYMMKREAVNFLSFATLTDPGRVQSVMTALGGAIETDPALDMFDLGRKLMSVGGAGLTTVTIPISGTPTIRANGASVSVVEVDTAAMPDFIAGILSPSKAAVVAPSAVSSVTVTVLNGGTTNGAAAAATAVLAGLGFATLDPGSIETRTTTTIKYPPGAEADALAVAAYLPGATLTASSLITGVTVVLGTDGLTPSATPASDPVASPTPAATTSDAVPCID